MKKHSVAEVVHGLDGQKINGNGHQSNGHGSNGNGATGGDDAPPLWEGPVHFHLRSAEATLSLPAEKKINVVDVVVPGTTDK